MVLFLNDQEIRWTERVVLTEKSIKNQGLVNLENNLG